LRANSCRAKKERQIIVFNDRAAIWLHGPIQQRSLRTIIDQPRQLLVGDEDSRLRPKNAIENELEEIISQGRSLQKQVGKYLFRRCVAGG
jgi:hypothetical protein